MAVLWLFFAAALLVLGQRWVFARFWAKKLAVRVGFDRATAEAGEDVVLSEQIVNRKLLPLPFLRYRYTLLRNFELYRAKGEQPIQVGCRLAVPALRSVRRKTVLHGLRRGVYTLTDTEMDAQDLFHTLSERQPFIAGSRLTVWPEKLDMRRLAVPCRQLLGAVLTRRSTQEDPFEIRNIRPYEIYDSMRTINWKATAKTGELKVNQNDYTTDEALCLILDAEHGSLNEREHAIRLASSLAMLFLRRGVSVSLIANGRSCIGGREIRVDAGSGIAHLRVIDNSLAQLKLGAEPTRPFAALLDSLRKDGVRALCAVISADSSDASCTAFDALCGSVGGYWLQLGHEPVQGRNFTVLPMGEAGEEAAS